MPLWLLTVVPLRGVKIISRKATKNHFTCLNGKTVIKHEGKYNFKLPTIVLNIYIFEKKFFCNMVRNSYVELYGGRDQVKQATS